MGSRKTKHQLEEEVASLQERLDNQSRHINLQEKDNEELRRRLASRGLSHIFSILLGAISVGPIVYFAMSDPSLHPRSTSSQQKDLDSLSSVIDTVPELQEFLDVEKTSDEQFNTRLTKASIQAFQEKCHYVLNLPMAITGEPNIETYVTATVIQNSPELLARLRAANHYSYTNRHMLDYEVRIPNIAISQVKNKLRDNESIETALDYRDPTLVRIAREVTAGKENALAKATRLLEFVQALPYDFDIDDYPKHPLETLADGGGDCEDTSILYASLARAVGIPSAVALVPQHAMAAVEVPSNAGWYADHGNRKYVLVETTGDRRLGDIAREFQRVGTQLIFPHD